MERRSIKEIGKPWRYAKTAIGCDYIEIDEHLTNYRPSTKKEDATVFCEIHYDISDNKYIRYKRHTYYIDD